MINAILTMELIAETRSLSVAPPLTVKLSHIHRRWMEETSQWLGPTLATDADFWNGWSAVRYINDQFDRQYRRKCAVVGAIIPLLRPSDALILCATTGMLERTRRDIDQAGRRQDMTELVATLVYRFLKLLRTWFAEIERVTAELTIDELPPDGQRALI
jgi:hypothetical protein